MKPEPVVAAIIENDENEILLCKSAKWHNQYVVPGGHIEFGETFEIALKREVFEETGLEIFDIELIGIKENFIRKDTSILKHYILFDFTCKTHSKRVTLNDEATEYIWCKLEDAMNYDLDAYTRSFLTTMLQLPKSFNKQIIYNI